MSKTEIVLGNGNSLGNIFSAIKSNIDDIYIQLDELVTNMQKIVIREGKYGKFVRVGMVAYYILGEYRIDEIEPRSYIVLDELPDDFVPAQSINKIAITNNSQLTESLLIRIDKISGKVKIMNMSTSSVTEIKILNSSYEFILSSNLYDTAPPISDDYDETVPQWEDIPESMYRMPVHTPEWGDIDDQDDPIDN